MVFLTAELYFKTIVSVNNLRMSSAKIEQELIRRAIKKENNVLYTLKRTKLYQLKIIIFIIVP